MAFIYLDRDIASHPLWTDKPFARGQAWVDLILLARFAPSQAYIRGLRIDLQRGELAMSQELLAERWGWSRGKVARFLDDMQDNSEIDRRQYNRIDIITVCNYNQYQSKQATDNTTDGRQTGGRRAARSAHNKEGKEGKEIPPTPKGDFSALWDSWQPYEMVKGNKSKAEAKYQAALDITTNEVLMAQAKAYCAQCAKLKTKTQHVATWLHQRGWETEYEPAKPEKTGFAKAGL
jgi:hypothetical protein